MMSDKYLKLCKLGMKYLVVVIILLALTVSAYKENTNPETGEISTLGAVLALALMLAAIIVLIKAGVNAVKAFKVGVDDLKALKHDSTQDL